MTRLVAVAVSGGRDSMALLHCTAHGAASLGIEVLALHVHHGLMRDADQWAAFVQSTCARWSRRWPLRFAMRRLQGKPARGQSVEAWARAGRYAALTAMAREAGATMVLLAHHLGDQAETFLLQALRGAGPAGLASMPSQVERDGIVWARPWLALPRASVEAYAERHRLKFVDDPSNDDPGFARSRLRANVMPALREVFPQAEAALAAAAAQAAQARVVIDEVASADLAQTSDERGLVLARWSSLSLARRREALRVWLSRAAGHGPSETTIERLLGEVIAGAAPARWPLEGIEVRRYRGHLMAALDAAGAAASLQAQPVAAGGIPRRLLDGAQWKPRQGSERFQRAPGTPPRSLKKQFQAAGVPAWSRDAPLLVAADGTLLFVPGLGMDARALAAPGAPRVSLEWVSDR